MKRCLFVLFLFSSLAIAQQRFACVEPSRILSESQLVKEKESQLRSKVEDYQKQLDQINKRLEELKKQIESKGITPSVREQRMKEYQKVEAEGAELQQKAQRELMEIKAKMEQEIIEKVKGISEGIAKSQGLTGILDCSAFVYIAPEVDITKEVIQRLDQQK
ncbi:MAG: OmpH family outer membrane protein [Aquificaceae bacterium]